jgi:peptidoglycan/LPS O-acetylase OafA/YrhL
MTAGNKPKYDLFILDVLRALAAFVVMVGHARWVLWEGYSEGYLKHPEQYGMIGKIAVYGLSIFRYGHEAVLLFFVLSGFVIHLRYARNLAANPDAGFDWWPFLVRRIRRIYPPFLFILLLTFILDRVGMQMGWSIYQQQTPNEILNNNVHPNHGWINLFGNLLFWQNGQVTVWGSNGPLWSLKYEWWFYMLYPILFWVTRKSVYGALLLVLALFATGHFLGATSSFFLFSVFGYLLSWWLGALLADIYAGRFRLKFSWLAPFSLLIPFLLYKGAAIGNELLRDTCWALGFTALIAACFWLQEIGVYFRFLKRLKWLSECSYTLYIIHFPIFVFMNGMILSANGNRMPRSLIWVFAGIAIVLVLSWLLHFVLEKPFIKSYGSKPAVRQPAS